VHSPAFESGIVKFQLEQQDDFLEEEKELLEPFHVSNIPTLVSPTKPTSLSAQALSSIKRRKVPTKYLSLKHIPPTVERLFSAARLILCDYPKSMDPYTFECLLFLKVNRKKWDINLVSKLVGK
jgi:hypothetical protein